MENEQSQSDWRSSRRQVHIPIKYHTLKGLLGCLGGLFLHLVISSLYQWGTINIYVTSYYKVTNDPDITLQDNAIAFPAMMICIGFTMRLGRLIAKRFGVLITLYISNVFCALCVFAASYMNNFGGFIIFYGILFGLSAGMTFMIPIVQCNKFFPGRKMYVNGFILIGTGLGSVIFGNFSYSYINPNQVSPVEGYYGEDIADRVPACLRYLAMLYLLIGSLGTTMMVPVINYNLQYAKSHKIIEIGDNEASSMKDAVCSFIFWKKILVLILSTCGVFLITGNYKTYVKEEIHDDKFLTLIGSIGAIGNGFSRFLWSVLFNKTGYKFVMVLNVCVCLIVLGTIRFSVLESPSAYLFLVFVINCCLGGFLVITPIFSQIAFGSETGSNIYGFFWCTYSLANFIQFGYVSGLTSSIGFNNIIYICMGMCVLSIPMVVVNKWQGPWENSTESLQFCGGGETSRVANANSSIYDRKSSSKEGSLSVQVMIKQAMSGNDMVKQPQQKQEGDQ